MTRLDLSSATFQECVTATVSAARRGELILFPTDTVYGLGGLAFSQSVLQKLQMVKPDRDVKPTAVLIDNIIRMSHCAQDVPSPKIVALAERFWPGPLTMVWNSSSMIPEAFRTPDRSLGYRVPNSPFLLAVLKELEYPMWATSANLPGQDPPRLFVEIKETVISACDIVIRTRELLSGRSSTVVDVRGREPVVVRESAIREEDIKQVWRKGL